MDDINEAGRNMSIMKEILQWVQAIIFAVIVALLLRAFVFEPVYVDGPSMKDTMVTGDRLIVYKLGYVFSPPQRGDIVVLKVKEGSFSIFPFLDNILFLKKAIPNLDEIDYIKRVVGVPGDTVDIREGFVYINDEKLDEPYALGNTNKYSGESRIKITEGKYFVMGDNRENSRDSRHIGLIDIENIKGKAVFRMWPLDKIGGIY
jgi:signal peptidase I